MDRLWTVLFLLLAVWLRTSPGQEDTTTVTTNDGVTTETSTMTTNTGTEAGTTSLDDITVTEESMTTVPESTTVPETVVGTGTAAVQTTGTETAAQAEGATIADTTIVTTLASDTGTTPAITDTTDGTESGTDGAVTTTETAETTVEETMKQTVPETTGPGPTVTKPSGTTMDTTVASDDDASETTAAAMEDVQGRAATAPPGFGKEAMITAAPRSSVTPPRFTLPSQIPTRGPSSCYNETTREPQHCQPPFKNVAYGVPIEATNTCGERYPVKICLDDGCSWCDARDPNSRHPAEHMTDADELSETGKPTFWASETMWQGVGIQVIQGKPGFFHFTEVINQVNLTLDFDTGTTPAITDTTDGTESGTDGAVTTTETAETTVEGKSFEVAYVRLKFHKPRPASFAIYKKEYEDSTWVPWQYYSAICRDQYGVIDQNIHNFDWDMRQIADYASDTAVYCTSDYSDIIPTSGGNVPFTTLEGRPSREHFEETPALQSREQALFCKCNGHADECEMLPDPDTGEWKLSCLCEHNTMGRDCEQCKPFHRNQPWRRANKESAYACE
ncbi:unnamed protein product, partial [Cyprideis torosa]